MIELHIETDQTPESPAHPFSARHALIRSPKLFFEKIRGVSVLDADDLFQKRVRIPWPEPVLNLNFIFFINIR